MFSKSYILFEGLDKDPKFLADSMSATTSPEKAAEANVLVSGGFDPCQYEVKVQKRCQNDNTVEIGYCDSIFSVDIVTTTGLDLEIAKILISWH